MTLPSYLMYLRLLRAFRVFRLFKRVKSLNKIIVSLGRAAPAAARSRRRPRASRLSSGLPTNSPFLLPKRRRAVAAIGAERARAFAGTQGRVTCSN